MLTLSNNLLINQNFESQISQGNTLLQQTKASHKEVLKANSSSELENRISLLNMQIRDEESKINRLSKEVQCLVDMKLNAISTKDKAPNNIVQQPAKQVDHDVSPVDPINTIPFVDGKQFIHAVSPESEPEAVDYTGHYHSIPTYNATDASHLLDSQDWFRKTKKRKVSHFLENSNNYPGSGFISGVDMLKLQETQPPSHSTNN